MPQLIAKEYQARLDTKNRLTLRGVTAKFYVVQILEGGSIVLSPQKLVPMSTPISEEILAQIGRSVGNLKKGKVGGPIDLNAARKLVRG